MQLYDNLWSIKNCSHFCEYLYFKNSFLHINLHPIQVKTCVLFDIMNSHHNSPTEVVGAENLHPCIGHPFLLFLPVSSKTVFRRKLAEKCRKTAENCGNWWFLKIDQTLNCR